MCCDSTTIDSACKGFESNQSNQSRMNQSRKSTNESINQIESRIWINRLIDSFFFPYLLTISILYRYSSWIDSTQLTHSYIKKRKKDIGSFPAIFSTFQKDLHACDAWWNIQLLPLPIPVIMCALLGTQLNFE